MDSAPGAIVKRPWIGERGDITLLHMNILADSLAKTSFPGTDVPAFPHVKDPEIVFDPNRRHELTIQALLEHDPDILCMSEVDQEQFDCLQCDTRMFHFVPLFGRKYSEDGSARDGSCIMYNAKRIACGNINIVRIRPAESQVVVMGWYHLRSDPTKQFIVAETHLKAKPGHEYHRVLQVTEVMAHIAKFRGEDESVPVFLLGDMNEIPTNPCILEIQSNLQFKFENAYLSKYKFDDSYWTTYKKRSHEVRRVIDYIFHQPHRAQCVGVAAIPCIDEFPDRLPCVNYPSDHLAMIASFKFINA